MYAILLSFTNVCQGLGMAIAGALAEGVGFRITFAVLGLLSALIGVYGVMSFFVTQRSHELGLRMALGARPADALTLVLRQGTILATGGMLLGVPLALLLTRLISSQLFGVNPTDPLTYTVVSALLVGVTLLATYIPAWRATRVDPLVALRHE